MSEFNVPVIDVSAIHSNDSKQKRMLAEEILAAYAVAGFGYVVNHEVPEELTDRVFAASARFHSLPLESKMAVELNHLHRGYIPINTSTDVNSKIADVRHPNQSESFMIMREDAADSPDVLAQAYLAGPNQWPELAGFQSDVMEYHNAMLQLARKLVAVVALSLDADAQFLAAFDRPTTWLRLLHYPPAAKDQQSEGSGIYGSAPHTDFGCLTLLAQDDIGGLQVQTPEGTWLDVPKIPNSFVVNVGDMLHRWSNGRLRSTPHRVINTSGRARYSCPFFYDPNVATDIAPLASCVSSDKPSAYSPINFGNFLKGELKAGYKKHQKG